MKYDNFIKKYKSNFYSWWFETYGDTEYCPRFKRFYYNSEYGISISEFLSVYHDEAMQDAHEFFEQNNTRLEPMVENWLTSLRNQVLYIQDIINQANE